MTRRRSKKARPAAVDGSALRLGAPGTRLAALRALHAGLLKEVARKRRDLEKMEEEMQAASSGVGSRLEPIRAAFFRVDGEIHALFSELLAPGRLSKRARGELRQAYRQLQERGILSTRDAEAPLDDGDRESDPPEEVPRPPSDAGGFTAERPEAATPGGLSLRALFLRLAAALHPDKVQDEDEKATRTETMKEVTRAYREGDLARLIELGRRLEEEQPDEPADVDDAAARCAALERTNLALRQQLRAVARALRDLRHSALGRLVQELRRRGRAEGGDPIASVVAESERDLAMQERLRDFVRAFRDGDISLDELLAGPPQDDGAGENHR